jgi:hypothetical protein
MSQSVNSGFRGVVGVRSGARTGSPPGSIPGQAREAGEGPRRENSLRSLGASLAKSLGHKH